MILTALMSIAFNPAPSLSPAQQQDVEGLFTCPESLPDDDARIMAVRRFVSRYGHFAPRSSMGERMGFWKHLLARNECAETDHDLIHTFPET